MTPVGCCGVSVRTGVWGGESMYPFLLLGVCAVGAAATAFAWGAAIAASSCADMFDVFDDDEELLYG